MRKIFFERVLPLAVVAMIWTGWGYTILNFAAG
jgi:hypothetical protein